MKPSDRPVIAEPEERANPAPFRIRLGDVVHLNGSIPRGVPLEEIAPHRCRGCSGLGVRRGFLYCDACRAHECRVCYGRDGQHVPSCRRRQGRRCRGCRVELDVSVTTSRYCASCQLQRCPECATRGGRHGARCRYGARRRKPRLTVRYGIVTVEHILELYSTTRMRAIRKAAAIVGAADAEDVVHDVVEALLTRREFLREVPGGGFFVQCARNAALVRVKGGWHRWMVCIGLDDELYRLASPPPDEDPEPVA